MTESNSPTRATYAGLFLVTLATLMFEILLTRIFSVTLWYHFAFVAVSVAMFGLTAGALAIYLIPRWFPQERTRTAMAVSAAAFGASLVAAVLVHITLRTDNEYRLAITYLLTSVPFVFSGICVCLALTRYPGAVGRLYAVDLAGAALGCIALILLLAVMDGVSAVFAIGALALGAALVWAPPDARKLRVAAAGLAMLMGGLAALNNIGAHRQEPLFAIRWTKIGDEVRPVYERWNAFSRITVHAYKPTDPVGWGLSPTYRAERSVPLAWLVIDAGAGTLLTEFKGDLREVDYLRFDIINLAHHLRPAAKTAVIGAGGGRDVLSALLFKAPQVVALEFNGVTLDTVNGRFAKFTGHLDRIPGVTFVHDEARSWLARSPERFDLIQASWIDTWAATAAGAFVLSENSLYTREAWRIFLDHLTPSGIVTFSRFYSPQNPREAARLTALARAALLDRGVAEPERHIMLAATRWVPDRKRDPTATILVSSAPFSAEDVARMRAVCDELQFDLVLAPGLPPSAPPLVRAAAAGEALSERTPFAYSIVAPTDDRPFFFNMLSLTSLLDPEVRALKDANILVARTLFWLLATVVGLAALCVGLPLVLRSAEVRPRGADAGLVAYFAAIGLGFMFVEIALLQRLAIFLGHPTYALGVLLFGLLLSCGAGSFLATRGRALAPVLLALLALLIVTGALGLPRLALALEGEPTPARIGVALAFIAPPGVLMGMAFPFGVSAALGRRDGLLPWLWGINGAASVLASVLAVLIALELGIGANLWIGAACYLVAAAALAAGNRGRSATT
jgi:hypothetical protein